MQGNSQGISLLSIVGAIQVFRIDVIRRVAFSGTSRFSAHVSRVPARPSSSRRDVYVRIFWSKKLIVRLNDSGIIDRSSKKY